MSARQAVTAGYGLTGLFNALWGATLATTDARLDLGTGRLGHLLLAMALGALVAMPIAGRLAERWTGRRLLRFVLPAAALASAGPAIAPAIAHLVVAAVVLGVLSGALNVALSVQAVAVERVAGKPVMATMHGTWTLGAVAGGVAVSVGLRLGVDGRLLSVIGAAAVALAGLSVGKQLTDAPHQRVPAGTGDRTSRFPAIAHPAPRRTGVVILLGLIGASAFITEGAATDWGGVHATRVLRADPATASLVYAAFFAAMTVVRFAGDLLRTRFGAGTTVRLAGTVTAMGYALILLAGLLPTSTPARIAIAIGGWAVAGGGIAVIWPVVTSALGAAHGTARQLSAVTAISYGGGLIGPVLIGSVAAATSLEVALLIPAALALTVAIVAPAVLVATLPSPSIGSAGQTVMTTLPAALPAAR